MGKMNQEDLKLIEVLKETGVFIPVDQNKIKLDNGVILVCCADGDQMPDIFTYHLNMSLQQSALPRIHTLALNGGALLIADESPLVQEHNEDAVLIKHIIGARRLKNIHTVVSYAHAPCGAAGLAELSLQEVIELQVKGTERLHAIFPDLQVIQLFHVDDGKDKKSYYLSSHGWDHWKNK